MVSLKGQEIVIFGGSGFIGSNLAMRLLKEGAHITIVDNRDLPGALDKRMVFRKVDITQEKGLKAVLRGKDYVFNLASALPFSCDRFDYLKESIEVNVKGAINIAVGCKENGIKKLVFASAYVVYGRPQYLPIDESHPTEPHDIYGASKLAAEKYLQVIIRDAVRLGLVILRFSTIYGPGQTSRGLIPNLMQAACGNSGITLFAEGKERRDYLFIDDAISALLFSLKGGVNGTFNIGKNESVSAQKVKDIIERISCRRIKTIYKKTKALIPDVVLSNALAERCFSFEPRVSLEKGLALAYQWYSEYYSKRTR